MTSNSPNPRTPPKRGRIWLMRLGAIAFALLLCEVGLTVVRRASSKVDYYLRPPWDRAQIDDEVLGFAPTPHYPLHDDWGFRNDAVPETADAIAVGDSLTYGYSAPPDKAWPRLLSDATGHSVYTLAFGGYGPCEYQHLVKRGLQLQPQAVLVGTYIANDISDCYKAVYLQGRFQEFRSDDPELLQSLEAADREGTLPDILWEHMAWTREDASFSPVTWFKENSGLYGLVRELSGRVGGSGKDYKSPFRDQEHSRDRFEVASQRHHRFVYDHVPAIRTCFLPPRALDVGVNVEDPRIREGQRVYKRAMLSLRDAAAEAGVPLLVAVMPSKHVVYRDLLAAAGYADSDPRWQEMQRLIAHEMQVTDELEAFFAANGIRSVNTGDAFRTALAASRKVFPESDDEHPDGAGYGLVAEIVQPAYLELIGQARK